MLMNESITERPLLVVRHAPAPVPEEVHVEHSNGEEHNKQVDEYGDESSSQPRALRPHKQPVELGKVSEGFGCSQHVVVVRLQWRTTIMKPGILKSDPLI